MSRRCSVALALAVVVLTLSSSAAWAAPALVAIDDATPTMQQQDDGSWSGTLDLTNLTDEAVSLTVRATDDAGAKCTFRLTKKAIGAAQSVAAKVTAAHPCTPVEDELAFTVTAAGGDATQPLAIVGETEADTEPDWSQLWAFVIALVVVGVALVVVFVGLNQRSPRAELVHLEATYDFKESWISNLTVVAGVLTGLFGSAEVVKAFLGEDADRSIALAIVGSAVAVILIGIGPVILMAARSEEDEDGELVQPFTVGGLLAATTFPVAGAAGQLWVGWKTGAALDLGGWEDRIWVAFALAGLLLAWYTVATVSATIKAGLTAPPPPPPSDIGQLAALLAAALTKNDQVPNDAVPSVVEDVVRSYPAGVTRSGAAGSVTLRRRSAMP